jgi:uncharacterized protein
MVAALQLQVLVGSFAIVRLDPRADVPMWATAPSALCGILRTADELTLICEETADNALALSAIDATQRASGWCGLRVAGTLDFALTGILAGLSTTLAQAGISIFALSTFATDYVLVRQDDLPATCRALQKAGHSFVE